MNDAADRWERPPGPLHRVVPRQTLEGRRLRRPSTGFLSTDLVADNVLLPVQHPLFRAGDMRAILADHVPLLLADRPVLLVQLARLLAVDLTGSPLLVNTRALVREPAVHLGASRMVLLPMGLGTRRADTAGA